MNNFSNIYKNLNDITNILPGIPGAYIVGGAVRDILLGKIPIDYDIAVIDNPYKFAKILSNKINGTLVRLGNQRNMLFRVVCKKHHFDITQINGNSIEDDINLRDFTVNAMGYDLCSNEIIDIVNGANDLKQKKLCMVSKYVFKNDPIRLIRAFRIAALLDFKIDSHTLSTIAEHAKLIKNSAGERIRTEILKLFATSGSYNYLTQMVNTGLIFEIFPELMHLKNCKQNEYHKYDAFEHTLKAYYYLEQILNNNFEHKVEQFKQNIDKNRVPLLKCAILLHDIGKPVVQTFDEKIHFYGHDSKGANMAIKICKKLKFSNNETQFIESIIRNHLRPMHLFLSFENKTLKNKGLIRFFVKCDKLTTYILIHSIADFKAKGSDDKRSERFICFVNNLYGNFYFDFKQKKTGTPLLTGSDLIQEFGLTPSPVFKKILNHIEEARLCNIIKNRDDAIAMVKNMKIYSL